MFDPEAQIPVSHPVLASTGLRTGECKMLCHLGRSYLKVSCCTGTSACRLSGLLEARVGSVSQHSWLTKTRES